MATSRELKSLLRPLLERRRDLAFVGRTLFFAPFTHYWRGVVFVAYWTTSASEACAFAHQLCNGQGSVDFASHRDPGDYLMAYDWKDDLDKASRELCDYVEQIALPSVEPIVDFARHRNSPRYFEDLRYGSPDLSPTVSFRTALGACTEGDFDTAEAVASKMLQRFPEYSTASATEDKKYNPHRLWRLAYLQRTLQTNRQGVLPLLHDWEAFAVKSSKVTKYWKPTPFPCE